MRKRKYLIFIVCAYFMMALPFVGMIFWPTNETTENTELAEWPSILEDGKRNERYLSDVGAYFEDHFAFRQELVTINSFLRGKILKESTTKQVIVGKNDWLYYGGTLNDYKGENLISQRELHMLAHNLKLMQQYVESQGSRFVLTIVPNKNSLYDENMPYYYQKGSESNLKNAAEFFEANGIAYLDLYKIFKEKEEVLYFQRDSHWNNQGALLAYNALMNYLGKSHETYLNVPFHIEVSHEGDLDKMLYPLATTLEEEYVYDKEWNYNYVNDVRDNMEDWIETESVGKEGTLLMFRDSFGESLLPFVAEEVGKGYFSRLVPYNLTQIEQYKPNYLVIEKVERNLIDFVKKAPIMQPMQVEDMSGPEVESDSLIETEKQGSYLMIKGEVDHTYINDYTELYISIRNEQTAEIKTYPVFYTLTENDEKNGYQIYLKGSSMRNGRYHVNVMAQNLGQTIIVDSTDIVWE